MIGNLMGCTTVQLYWYLSRQNEYSNGYSTSKKQERNRFCNYRDRMSLLSQFSKVATDDFLLPALFFLSWNVYKEGDLCFVQ